MDGSPSGNSTHRNIREILLGSAGVGRCPGLSNRCTFGLANLLDRRYTPATELELIRFWPLTSGDLVWHLISQVNDCVIAAYINVFDPRNFKHRHFIPVLVYHLVHTSIASNLIILANLSPWYESVCMYTCFLFLRKHLLRRHRTVETGLLIKW